MKAMAPVQGHICAFNKERTSVSLGVIIQFGSAQGTLYKWIWL